MTYHYRTEYNDSCNCHPEMHEIEVEAETLEEFARLLAGAEADAGRRHGETDLSDVRVRRELEEAEHDQLESLMVAARETEKTRRGLAEAERRREEQRAHIRSMRADLDRQRPDLNAEAIARREAMIEMAEKGIV